MATARDIDFLYTMMDPVFRLSLGQTGDYSGAMYKGDFSLSLENAQLCKHTFIAEQLHIGKGSRVLDVGCGWGGFLTHIKSLGAKGQGITLSRGQANACNRNGLQVSLMDARHLTPQYQGIFDAITCIDCLEHICSLAQWQAGKQTEIYTQFLDTLAQLLPKGGLFYMQTMVFGPNPVSFEQMSLNAPKDSDAYALAQTITQFPGGWLPVNQEQIIACAQPGFRLISVESGRLDYMETLSQWHRRFRKFTWRKYWHYLLLVPHLSLQQSLQSIRSLFFHNPTHTCFQRQILEHYRFVFEKI